MFETAAIVGKTALIGEMAKMGNSQAIVYSQREACAKRGVDDKLPRCDAQLADQQP